jgi:acyl-CoA synthetase (AMP-forming)/AMP-acid ligase II
MNHTFPFNLGDLTDPHADRAKTALIDCADWDHPHHYSYGEFEALVTACARGLLRRGLRRGDAVAIAAKNCAPFLALYFAAMRAGMVAVPVNHKFPRDTIAFVLKDCAARAAFCDTERLALLPEDIDVINFDDEAAWQGFLDPGPFETVVPEPDEAAMVLYTSGSTGRPKGVLLSHAGHLWAVRSRLRSGPYDTERLIVAAPLFHMNGLGTAKFVFAAHASMVLLPQFDARHYLEAIGTYRVTWLTSVPTMLAMILKEEGLLAHTDLSSVKYVRMGSAPASSKLIDKLRETFPKARIANVYGTTEAGPVMFGPHPDGRPKADLALGWPMPEVEVRIVGPDGREADEGVLWIRTPANMIRYLNLPEKTREALTPEGWYISGDLFRRDGAGAFHCAGRADDMFICGGENIYPGEVEQLLERHAAVLQACVVPVADEIKGEKPVAFVVLRLGAQATEAQLRQHALDHAPAYQHPRRVFFVDQLPLAGTNKIDRKLLKERASAAPQPRGA